MKLLLKNLVYQQTYVSYTHKPHQNLTEHMIAAAVAVLPLLSTDLTWYSSCFFAL